MPNKKTFFQRARELLTRSSSTEENTTFYPREENGRVYYGYDFADENQRATEILRMEQLQMNQRNRLMQEMMRTPPHVQWHAPQTHAEDEIIGDDDNTSLASNGTTNFIECPHCANEFVIDNNGEVEVMCTACGEDIDVFGIGKEKKKRNRVDHQVIGNRQPNRITDEGGYGFYVDSAQQGQELRGRQLDRITVYELTAF